MDKTAKTNGASEIFLTPPLNMKDVDDTVNEHFSNPRNLIQALHTIAAYMSTGMVYMPKIKELHERVEYLEKWRDVAIDVLKRHNLKGEFNDECSKVFDEPN